MAITFVNSTQDDTGVATSVSVALPASVQDDDLLLAYAFNGQDDGTWSAPAGWTNVMTKADAVGSDSNVGVWYKVAFGTKWRLVSQVLTRLTVPRLRLTRRPV